MDFPLDFVRSFFPALAACPSVLFDNGAGTQVPRSVVEAVGEHLTRHNVGRGAGYPASQEVEQHLGLARESLAAFVNAHHPDEVVFGSNATSLIRLVSSGFVERLRPADEIVVTELDHEANIAPWVALEKHGMKVKFWRVDKEGARLSLETLDEVLTERTRLVAVTKASNAVGTIVELLPVAEKVHARGAHLFVDASHFSPHGPVDVRYLGCDFLVSSGHKMFAPHLGFLWGRKDLLDSLPSLGEYFIEERAPGKLEMGTPSFEAIAGMNAAIGYVEELGRRSRHLPLAPTEEVGRRGDLRRGMQAIRHYERILSEHLLSRVREVGSLTVYGIADPEQAALRTPTLCFNVVGMAPREVTRRLAERGILVRDGHLDCPRLMRALGLAEQEGAVRASLVHYNTVEEADRFVDVLRTLSV